MSYDIKFRKRTIEYLAEGHTYRETARIFGISPNTLNSWVKKQRATGNLKPQQRTYSTKIPPKELEEYIAAFPDAYQHEIAKHFKCAQSTVGRTLSLFKITRKKR